MAADERGPIRVRIGHHQARAGGIDGEGSEFVAAVRVSVTQNAHVSPVSADCRPRTGAGIWREMHRIWLGRWKQGWLGVLSISYRHRKKHMNDNEGHGHN